MTSENSSAGLEAGEHLKRKVLLPGQYGRWTFIAAVLLMTALSFVAVWWPRFPAMQDYPQHLFMAQVLSTYNDANYNWGEFYTINPTIGPYSLFFLIVQVASAIAPVEIAGKMFISVALCLVSAMVYFWSQYSKHEPRWSLLLVFPLFFSQVYYLGFTNYVIAIPILFLALLVHDIYIKQKPNLAISGLYAVMLILLFLSHPYAILVYIALSLSITFFSLLKREVVSPLGSFAPIIITTVLMAIWYVDTFGLNVGSATNKVVVSWWPVVDVFNYFLLPFYGFHTKEAFTNIALVLWCGTGVVIAIAAILQKDEPRLNKSYLAALIIALCGYGALPFWLGDYSYFNLRLSIVCYFLITITLSDIRFPPKASYVLIAFVTALMLNTIQTQRQLSEEISELTPLLARMDANELVYPVYLDSSSNIISPDYFYQFHAHNHFYYHILVGGGATPALFPSRMNPVNFRADTTLPPMAENPNYYRYILVRGAQGSTGKFGRTHFPVSSSGTWQLYERRP